MICGTIRTAASTLCSVALFLLVLLLGPVAVVLGQSAATIDATVSQSAGTLWLTTGTFSKLTIVNVGTINVVVRDVTVTSGGITVSGVGSTACTLLFSRVTSTSTTNDANAGALVFTEPVRCHKFQIIGSTFSMHAPSQPWRAGVMLGGGVFSSTLFEITDSTITGRGRSGTGAVRSPGAIQGIAHFKILRSTFLGRNDYGGDHGNALFFTAGVKSVTLWSVIDSVLEGQNHLGRVASAIYLDHGVHDVQAIRFQGTTLRSKAQRVSMNFYIWAPYPTSRGIRNVDSVQFIDCLFDSEGLQSSASAVAWIGGQDNFRSFVFERSTFDIRTPSGTVCLSLHASIPDGHTMDIDELVFKDSTMKTTTPGSGTAMTFSGVNAIKNVRIENTTAEMAMGSHTSFMQFGHAVTLANSKYAITGSTIRMTGATALNVAAVRFLAAVTAPNFNLNVSDTTIVIDAQGPRCSAILFTVGSTGTNGDLAFHNTDITVKGANSPGKKEIAVLVTNGTAADFNSVVISGGRWVSSGYDYVFGTRFMAGLRSTSRFVVEDVEISATTLGSGFAYTLFAERFHLVNYIQIRRSRISSKSATTHALAVHVQQGVISGTTFSIEDSVIEATSNVVAAAVYLDGGLKHWTNVLVHNTTLRSRSVQENARGFFVYTPAPPSVDNIDVFSFHESDLDIASQGQTVMGLGVTNGLADVTLLRISRTNVIVRSTSKDVQAFVFERAGFRDSGEIRFEDSNISVVGGRGVFALLCYGGIVNLDAWTIVRTTISVTANNTMADDGRAAGFYVDNGIGNIRTVNFTQSSVSATSTHTAYAFFGWTPSGATMFDIPSFTMTDVTLSADAAARAFSFVMVRDVERVSLIASRTVFRHSGITHPVTSASAALHISTTALVDSLLYFHRCSFVAADGTSPAVKLDGVSLLHFPTTYTRSNITFDSTVLDASGVASSSRGDHSITTQVLPAVVDTVSPRSWVALSCADRPSSTKYGSTAFGAVVAGDAMPVSIQPIVVSYDNAPCLVADSHRTQTPSVPMTPSPSSTPTAHPTFTTTADATQTNTAAGSGSQSRRMTASMTVSTTQTTAWSRSMSLTKATASMTTPLSVSATQPSFSPSLTIAATSSSATLSVLPTASVSTERSVSLSKKLTASWSTTASTSLAQSSTLTVGKTRTLTTQQTRSPTMHHSLSLSVAPTTTVSPTSSWTSTVHRTASSSKHHTASLSSAPTVSRTSSVSMTSSVRTATISSFVTGSRTIPTTQTVSTLRTASRSLALSSSATVAGTTSLTGMLSPTLSNARSISGTTIVTGSTSVTRTARTASATTAVSVTASWSSTPSLLLSPSISKPWSVTSSALSSITTSLRVSHSATLYPTLSRSTSRSFTALITRSTSAARSPTLTAAPSMSPTVRLTTTMSTSASQSVTPIRSPTVSIPPPLTASASTTVSQTRRVTGTATTGFESKTATTVRTKSQTTSGSTTPLTSRTATCGPTTTPSLTETVVPIPTITPPRSATRSTAMTPSCFLTTTVSRTGPTATQIPTHTLSVDSTPSVSATVTAASNTAVMTSTRSPQHPATASVTATSATATAGWVKIPSPTTTGMATTLTVDETKTKHTITATASIVGEPVVSLTQSASSTHPTSRTPVPLRAGSATHSATAPGSGRLPTPTHRLDDSRTNLLASRTVTRSPSRGVRGATATPAFPVPLSPPPPPPVVRSLRGAFANIFAPATECAQRTLFTVGGFLFFAAMSFALTVLRVVIAKRRAPLTKTVTSSRSQNTIATTQKEVAAVSNVESSDLQQSSNDDAAPSTTLTSTAPQNQMSTSGVVSQTLQTASDTATAGMTEATVVESWYGRVRVFSLPSSSPMVFFRHHAWVAAALPCHAACAPQHTAALCARLAIILCVSAAVVELSASPFWFTDSHLAVIPGALLAAAIATVCQFPLTLPFSFYRKVRRSGVPVRPLLRDTHQDLLVFGAEPSAVVGISGDTWAKLNALEFHDGDFTALPKPTQQADLPVRTFSDIERVVDNDNSDGDELAERSAAVTVMSHDALDVNQTPVDSDGSTTVITRVDRHRRLHAISRAATNTSRNVSSGPVSTFDTMPSTAATSRIATLPLLHSGSPYVINVSAGVVVGYCLNATVSIAAVVLSTVFMTPWCPLDAQRPAWAAFGWTAVAAVVLDGLFMSPVNVLLVALYRSLLDDGRSSQLSQKTTRRPRALSASFEDSTMTASSIRISGRGDDENDSGHRSSGLSVPTDKPTLKLCGWSLRLGQPDLCPRSTL